eukprot:scaffold118804_cov63-Attheya_sp.AAC.5
MVESAIVQIGDPTFCSCRELEPTFSAELVDVSSARRSERASASKFQNALQRLHDCSSLLYELIF